MLHTLQRTLLATVAAALATLALVASAGSIPGGEAHDPERMLRFMSDRLDPSADQRDAVSAVLREHTAQTSADRARLQRLHEELRATRGEFDESAAQLLANDIGELSGRLALQKARMQADIYQLLNPEQRAQMDALQAEREERRGLWRSRFRTSDE